MSRFTAANSRHQPTLDEGQCFGAMRHFTEQQKNSYGKNRKYITDGGDKVFERGTLGI
jgi:hypothetical protein